MERRISLAGVVLGIGATAVAFPVVFFLPGVPLFPVLFVEGSVVGSPAWYAHAVLAALPVVGSWLLTFFLGGLVAGRVAPAHPGLNGAVCAGVAMLGIFVLFVVPEVHWLWYPAADVGDRRVRAENLGLLGLWVGALCAATPFAILGGYAGGRAGARLRGGPASGSAR